MKQPTTQRGQMRDGARISIGIRDVAGEARASVQRWVHERLGRQLGKFAPQIERVDVRFCDENGKKGGQDQSCMVHVLLSALPPVIVESLGGTAREAFDLAAGRAERATLRNLEKHGFSTGHKGRQRASKAEGVGDGNGEVARSELVHSLGERAHEVLLEADQPPHTGHTGRRNPKHNDSRMTYALEDSPNGQPRTRSGC